MTRFCRPTARRSPGSRRSCAQFPELSQKVIKKLPEQLTNPLKYRLRSILSVAEGDRGEIKGFALLLHAPDLKFCYLEYISAAEKVTGRGVGGALAGVFVGLYQNQTALPMVLTMTGCAFIGSLAYLLTMTKAAKPEPSASFDPGAEELN
jgi:hypothetical protein